MEIVRKRLESCNEDLPEIANWSAEEICTGLRICLQVTHFEFRNKFFQQMQSMHGIVMGSPVLVVVNLVKEEPLL